MVCRTSIARVAAVSRTPGVDFSPDEVDDLAPTPPGVVGEVEDVLVGRRKAASDREVFGVLEEPLAWRILFQLRGEGREVREEVVLDSDAEHPSERRCFPIDGRARRVLPQSTVGVLSLTYLHARVWAVV